MKCQVCREPKQIAGVFTEAGEAIKRTSSGIDLMNQLGQATPRLLCSLIHKFGRKDVDDFDAFDGRETGTIFCATDENEMGKLQRW